MPKAASSITPKPRATASKIAAHAQSPDNPDARLLTLCATARQLEAVTDQWNKGHVDQATGEEAAEALWETIGEMISLTAVTARGRTMKVRALVRFMKGIWGNRDSGVTPRRIAMSMATDILSIKTSSAH